MKENKILVIGRGYVGKALEAYDEFDVISHTVFLTIPAIVEDYDAVVNAAGIVGYQKCNEAGYDAVIEANVKFPITVQAACAEYGAIFFQLTTVGISRVQVAPTSDVSFSVNDPIYPHNLYCASKILLEVSLKREFGFILRMPWVVDKGVFESRVQHWDAVQDTYTSVLEIEDLRASILDLVSNPKRYKPIYSDAEYPVTSGIQHLKSYDVYFPDFINKLLSSNLPIRRGISKRYDGSDPDSVRSRSEYRIYIWNETASAEGVSVRT